MSKTVSAGVLIALLGILGLVWSANQQRKERGEPSLSVTDVLPLRNRSATVYQGEITVEAGKHYRVFFNVRPGAQDARITGRFEAIGGLGNDVRAKLFERDAYINWTTGHNVPVLFASERLTVGNIEARLVPGEYVLVIDNQEAWLISRKVNLDVTLRYKSR